MRRQPSSFLAIGLGVGLAVAVIWWLSLTAGVIPVQAQAAIIRVAPTGVDEPGCGNTANLCATIRYALDSAQANDIIQVAQGVYSGTLAITKSLQLLGGYEAVNWTRDIAAYTTVISGNQAGSVIQITGGSTVTVEGFDIVAGRATYGGGIYIAGASPTVTNNHIRGNTATSYGGGLYVASAATPLILSNTVEANTGSLGGGGVFITGASPTLSQNTITSNTVGSYQHGAGVYVSSGSYPLIISNTVAYNTTSYGWGGGFYIVASGPTLEGNDIHHNQAGSPTYATTGGGIQVESSTGVVIRGNHIHDNTAYVRGGGIFLKGFTEVSNNLIENNWASSDEGAGISIWGATTGVVSGNVIIGNTGSGVHLWYFARPTLSFNLISGNTSSGVHITNYAYPALNANRITGNTGTLGGGIRIDGGAHPSLTNNVIADNQAGTGGGVYVSAASPQFVHNTLARNGGDGNGVYAILGSSISLTNTILVSQTVGITVTAGSTATVNGVLWFSNGSNTAGSGAITVTSDYTGDPVFATDGYHLLNTSAATDQGISAGLTTDVDGQSRPSGPAPDLGADEFPVAPTSVVIDGPTMGMTNAPYTYTVAVGPVTATTPLTYMWEATGQSPITHTGGFSDTTSFTWGTPGVQVITVMVMNEAGGLTATLMLTLEEATPTPIATVTLSPSETPTPTNTPTPTPTQTSTPTTTPTTTPAPVDHKLYLPLIRHTSR